MTNVTNVWYYVNTDDIPGVLFTCFGACTVGAVVRSLITKLPYTVILTLCGIVMGTLSFHYAKVDHFTTDLAQISPKLLTDIFMPVLIFSSAFEIESHTFRRSLSQVLLLAVPGCLLTCFLIAVLVVEVYAYEWDWYIGMMFGSIVSTFDCFITSSLLRKSGTSKALILIMEGESLFSEGTSFIAFESFKDLAVDLVNFNVKSFSVKLVLKVFGSPLLGYIMAKLIMFWLSYIFNDGLIEITISLAMTYITFYISEWLGMAGVISVLTMGLLLDTVNFSPEIEVFLLRFWETLTYLANTLIFFIVGIVIARAFQHAELNDYINIIVLYLFMYVIRLVTVLLCSPLLVRMGYGFSWRWAVVCIWGGTKGAFCLSLMLMAFQSEDMKLEVRDKVLVLVSGMVLLTLLINAVSMPWILQLLGLCDVSMPRRVAMYNAIKRIKESTENTLSMLKMDRFLADSNWEMAENTVLMEDPYRTPGDTVDVEEFSPMSRMTTCPDCDRTIPYIPAPRETEDMMEEARIRILKAQKMSYWKQYSSGMLNRQAARTLINTVENVTDQKGKFMGVQDIQKYWELKGVFVTLKMRLEDWLYNKVDKLKPPRHPVLRWCYDVVFSVPFEYSVYMLILCNIFIIVLEFVPSLGHYEYEISVLNYLFFIGYALEAIFKVLAMRAAYFFDPWNHLDVVVMILALVDIIVQDMVDMEDLHTINIVSSFKMLRILRVFHLTKVLIPKMIDLTNLQIHKQLSFGYDVGKGYVRLKEILETNRQDATREMGMLQRDYPEIAISVKTRQAIRSVLNNERDAIHTLLSGGLLDETEAATLKKTIEIKMKKLINFPPTIPAPTPEELLQSLPWLHHHEEIAFIKSVAKLLYFDFGDTIIEEKEAPDGIHLIVSGMVKTTGTKPSLGGPVDRENRVTDYRGCGSILGELNCLTLQPTEATVICETATQTCFIDIDSLFEAFDLFRVHPSLEYKIWHALAKKICIGTFQEHIDYQGWSYHRICEHLSRAFLVDLVINGMREVYDGNMEDVVVVYGSCDDMQLRVSYLAPVLINKTSHQIVGKSGMTKLMIIPSPVRSDQGSRPCQRHAALRKASEQDTMVSVPASEQDMTPTVRSSSVQIEIRERPTPSASRQSI
ncbi:sodium/hydrogen exchanger 10-like isoform X2 [Osmerus eperlanus]|uniref:sodium/hydrogen exchanger 10-like isoform X2 n=1 Tax=Osmerus eperlanus TaxID=29151 RepID=UPI002E13C846